MFYKLKHRNSEKHKRPAAQNCRGDPTAGVEQKQKTEKKMKKLMFNDKYGLTEAVLRGSKTMTRRVATYKEVADPNTWLQIHDEGRLGFYDGCTNVANSIYKIGEIVAIAQRYEEVHNELYTKSQQQIITDREKSLLKHYVDVLYMDYPGWVNKLYVRAEYMPHHIKITGIHLERMQDITSEDCIKEGVLEKWHAPGARNFYYVPGVEVKTKDDVYLTPQEAFGVLIDKTCGKGTWEKNPWVFVYTFELVD